MGRNLRNQLGNRREVFRVEPLERRIFLSTVSASDVTPDGTAVLMPTVGKSTLPTNVVMGEAAHGSVVVDVANTGSATTVGRITAAIYASQDGQIDASSILLGLGIRLQPLIRAGATLPVPVVIKSLPPDLDGTYSLLAQVTDEPGNTTASSSGPSLTASAPFLAFSDTVISTTLMSGNVSGEKTRATARVQVTNNGNIPSTGASTVAFYLSTDMTAADGTLIRSIPERLTLQPGASRTITIPLLSLPAVSDGDFFHVVAQVTDPRGNVTSAASNGQFDLAAPFVSLMPTLTAFTPLGLLKFSVANQGDIPSAGQSTITLLASATGNSNDTTTVLTEKMNLALLPGKSRGFAMQLSKAELALTAGATSLFLKVTDQNGVTQTSSLQ